jgi:hypothetical protein
MKYRTPDHFFDQYDEDTFNRIMSGRTFPSIFAACVEGDYERAERMVNDALRRVAAESV